MATTVYAFDVNETLLDVAALDPLFTRIFGQSGVWREWFAQMLQSAFVATITNHYADFGRIGGAALEDAGGASRSDAAPGGFYGPA